MTYFTKVVFVSILMHYLKKKKKSAVDSNCSQMKKTFALEMRQLCTAKALRPYIQSDGNSDSFRLLCIEDLS